MANLQTGVSPMIYQRKYLKLCESGAGLGGKSLLASRSLEGNNFQYPRVAARGRDTNPGGAPTRGNAICSVI